MRLWWIAVAVGIGLVAFSLVVDPAFSVGAILWVVIAGLFFGLFVVFLIRVARETWRGHKARLRGERRGPQTLQTILFRVMLVALFALFLAVLGIRWYSDRQNSRDGHLYGQEQALAVLDIANQTQPKRDVADPSSSGLDSSSTGIWFNGAAYEALRAAIERPPLTTTGTQTFLLNGREEQPPQAILPPSVYTEWKTKRYANNIMIPGYSFPFELLPPTETSVRKMRAAERVWLDYIKEHGWRVGWHGSGEDRVKYAMWRTGPNTAVCVVSGANSGGQIAWYLKPVQWGWQAIIIYIFLAPFAGIAAWYLSRKITGPVGRVAAASAVLAAGSHPDPIPVEGPAELATMARSFNRLSERLAGAEAAQKEFVGSVSHELKTPLTSLQGYGELLSDGAVPAEEAGPVVLAETARLERLVGDLLDSARVDSGQFSIHDEVVSLDRVAGAVVRRCSAAAGEFAITLSVRHGTPDGASEGEVFVQADEDRLVQVVGNLVENALRCTPSGGSVKIVVSAPATIRVVDTGPGLAEEDVPHAFERFFLYEKYGKERPVGTGLGLSIVRELVVAMGGTVSVLSNSGGGTAFSVELRPAGDEPATVGDPASGSPAENL